MAEDIQLLRQFVDYRADAAFAALVERHISFVYAAARRQLGGASHRAEDVTQTVFIHLARQAASLSRRDDIVGWLYTTTHYAASGLKRTEARRQRREREAQTMHELLAESSAHPDWDQLRPVLDDALLGLSERDRQAVLLRFFKNDGFAEVGRKLGLTEDAARMRVERALDKLHALLAKRGITSTASALGIALASEAAATAPAGLAASVTGAALSSTAVGIAMLSSGSFAAALHFMSAAKIFLVLGAGGAVAVGFVVHQSTQVRALTSELAASRAEHASLSARVAELKSEADTAEAAETTAVARRNAKTTSATATSAAMAPANSNTENRNEQKALQQFLDSDPELLKLKYDNNVARMKASTPVLRGRPTGGSPQQYASWKESQDAKKALDIEEPAPTRSPSAKDRARDSMEIVRTLTSSLFYLDEPFTAQQTTRLESIVADAATVTDASRYGRIEWDRVLRDAEPVLTPAQMRGLRGLVAQTRGQLLLNALAKQQTAATK